MSAPPLQVMFANPEADLCRFIYIPTLMPIFERPLYDFENKQIVPGVFEIQFGTHQSTQNPARTMAVVDGIEATNTLLLEYLIRIGGLDLAPDDFRDQTTGNYVCTNEMLFSLLTI